MKIGVDTNVLCYAHMPVFAEHERVRLFLQNLLKTPRVTLAVTPMVLHELVHVITDARRFDPPVPMSEALALARMYLDRANVLCIPCDEDSLKLALTLMDTHHLGRRRVADSLLASSLIHHGITRLVTCNPGDFRVFPDLEILDPLRKEA